MDAIANLISARDILDDEAQRLMPKGAKSQRDKVMATLDSVIAQAKGAAAAKDDASAYINLKTVFARYSDLCEAAAVLEWVQQTQSPSDALNTQITDGLAALETFKHRTLADAKVKSWIEDVKKNTSALNASDQRNFALMERKWMEAAGLDEALVDALSRATSASVMCWQKAKSKSDFETWLPHFEKVVELTRKKSDILGKTFGNSAYQAALDSYNPELKNETVNQIFGELRSKLPKLIQDITAHQAQEKPPLPLPPVAVDDQRRLGNVLTSKLGLDVATSRLDEAEHPFSTGQWDDVRVTTHYHEADALSSIYSIIHEVGHSFYSHHLPRASQGQPLGEAQSMWVHESQSIFWERQVAASPAFMEFLSALLKKELHVDGPEWSPENLHKLLTQVEPSFIRTEADAVTYPAHVILRHDLEQKLVDGTLAPKDVPAAWEKGIKELLGVNVPDHAHGAMQDVHWPSGAIGYFPAYTFGALAAAQLMEKARQEISGIDDLIRKGDFLPIRTWLTDKIHQHGSSTSGEALIEKATGKKLSAEPWLTQVKKEFQV